MYVLKLVHTTHEVMMPQPHQPASSSLYVHQPTHCTSVGPAQIPSRKGCSPLNPIDTLLSVYVCMHAKSLTPASSVPPKRPGMPFHRHVFVCTTPHHTTPYPTQDKGNPITKTHYAVRPPANPTVSCHMPHNRVRVKENHHP